MMEHITRRGTETYEERVKILFQISRRRRKALVVFLIVSILLGLTVRLHREISLKSSNDTDCPADKPRLRTVNTSFTAIEVQACGSLLERVRVFNEELHQLRRDALRSRGSHEWVNVAPHPEVKLLWTVRDDFLDLLANFTQLQMIMLPWSRSAGTSRNWNSLADHSNLLIQKYYEWIADDPLCSWIETPGTIKMKYDVTYNRTCHRDAERTGKPQSLSTLVLNTKPINKNSYWPNNGTSFPEHFYTDQPQFAFYIYVIRDAIVTEQSDVFSGNVKLVQYGCSAFTDTRPPTDAHKIPIHEEVFPIAQHWGTGTFHRMVEIIPRLSLYVDFLKRNPSIKILASETGGRTAELVRILGLDAGRLITGTHRAKLVYLPRASMCGLASVQEIQVLSRIYHDYIEGNFPLEPRNKIVLIRRSGSRRFTEQGKIEKILESAAKAFNLKYEMFIDNPVPSLSDTMRMFHAAVLVVAPHGAGLSNVVFSRPGTYVVEGVCNLPHANFCFQRLSYVLGHHWHGIPSRGGCEGVVDVSAETIERTVLTYLKLMSV